jgi:hypothetical protein
MDTFATALIFPDATARRFWTEQKINYTVAVRSKRSLKENSGSSSKKKAEDLPQVCFILRPIEALYNCGELG